MKQWVQKLIDQLDFETSAANAERGGHSRGRERTREGDPEISDERGTLLYILDCYSKHLFEIDSTPVRKARETFDEFAKELIDPKRDDLEKTMFRLRQFFSSYRVDEYAYVVKAFEDFKGIVWDFVDQLSEDFRHEQTADRELRASLDTLKEAVEADSVDRLRAKSREFIDVYVERQARLEERRTKRMRGVRKNLNAVKKKLDEAHQAVRLDHMTGARNRKSFDEEVHHQVQLAPMSKTACTMILLDIDHFKKVNDTFGHDVGDFAIKELVRMLKETFARDDDFVARIGGEEFAVILPHHAMEHAIKRAEDVMARVRKEVFVVGDGQELRFTISMGIAQLLENETHEQWIKRADAALYASKNGGRNRWTSAEPHDSHLHRVA